MNSITTVDLLQMETNSSSINLLARSKKLPPPPLCLPATNTMTDEEKILNSNQQRERKKSSNNCCLLSSLEDCPHKSVTYILPVSQRPKIIETLIASSSVLLVPPSSETKHKKSYNAAYANQINLLKQRQPSSKGAVTDSEWIDFMRLIVNKPLEEELKLLLDKYKMTYFDRVNAPNTTDNSIRSSLCTIVSGALAAYSSNAVYDHSKIRSLVFRFLGKIICGFYIAKHAFDDVVFELFSLPPPPPITDDLATNISSPVSVINTSNSGSSKRKRKHTNISLSIPAPVTINSQTKFVISHIIPGKYDNNNNGNTTINQQQQKQFQKKYSHLFKYIPNKDEQAYLTREDHLKPISNSSSRSSDNNNICLMLYDEVVNNIEEYDLEFSGISIDNSFVLPESFLARIYSTLQ